MFLHFVTKKATAYAFRCQLYDVSFSPLFNSKFCRTCNKKLSQKSLKGRGQPGNKITTFTETVTATYLDSCTDCKDSSMTSNTASSSLCSLGNGRKSKSFWTSKCPRSTSSMSTECELQGTITSGALNATSKPIRVPWLWIASTYRNTTTKVRKEVVEWSVPGQNCSMSVKLWLRGFSRDKLLSQASKEYSWHIFKAP